MSNNGNHYIMVKTERKQGQAFKRWCKAQGISMNRAFNIMMQKVINGNFICKHSIKSKK